MIPVRFDVSIALDDAVSCLCGIYLDSLRPTEVTSKESLRLYTRSLRSLRKSLDIMHVRAEAETICASIILQACELVMTDEGGRWSQLCMGTKLLIQERGPEGFIGTFERAMLESQRAWFILQDASVGQECFLSRRQWRQLLKSSSNPVITEESASISLRSELCEFLVDVPGLIREASNTAYQTLNSDTDSTELTERRKNAILQIKFVKHAFEWWYCTKIAPLRSISGALQQAKAERNCNRSPQDELLLAVVDCGSNSIMIKLDMLWASLDPDLETHKVDVLAYQEAQERRKMMMYQSLQFVRAKSLVAAKPLEFGLRQLWLDAGFKQSSKTRS
ncbi:uncharacterized protein A1O5_09801 [Cladophialophora psammophila CBS 110553]|uniref:Uncharacterized protein n=1 Tax=Cladophialophora psammophila CBS 110553 TaxID=1182543 RepID=W9X9N7_9EURO|nr:uncharacterized protein A1O5_09801 [Cladophialophora psammophila CBS 110553]EXJ67154.1 hypothetical protein A1O5_09801 [Cladophialophora psammophila CBS 110553]